MTIIFYHCFQMFEEIDFSSERMQNLELNTTFGLADVLHFSWQFGRYCGFRLRLPTLVTISNNLHIEFNTNNYKTYSKGFNITYEQVQSKNRLKN